ncbi:MAG TPA: hypothetical protein VM681_01840 [Candidatus Thermoplasmatota archaeon]|nr:hypothetical protein [Candidatus Thermoplasmatota archaeon]
MTLRCAACLAEFASAHALVLHRRLVHEGPAHHLHRQGGRH